MATSRLESSGVQASEQHRRETEQQPHTDMNGSHSHSVRDGTPHPGPAVRSWVGFPTGPKPEQSLSSAVLEWANEQGVEFAAPNDRSDVCRAVLAVGRRTIGERHPAWRRFCTQAVYEHMEECWDDEIPQARQVRRMLGRLIAVYGSESVLRALTETLVRPVALDGDPLTLLRYAGAILRRRADGIWH